MRVLTVNPGSSSLQLHVVEVELGVDGDPRVLDQRINEHRPDADTRKEQLAELLDAHNPDVVAHRLVHGGPRLRAPAVVTDVVLDDAREALPLAPQHVPATLAAVTAVREIDPARPQVLCPDTAFHARLPEPAATYALPARWRQEYGLRRYGFHGLSCAWALREACRRLNLPTDRVRMVIAHLGGGCSVTAVDGGRSVDTSMGFTPLEGMAMSTRSGSIDPGALLWLLEHGELDPSQLREGISGRSGLLGLSGGRTGDTRDLVALADEGDEQATLALAVFTHRARREIAGVAASLPCLDTLVFTGEIGADQPEVRDAITNRLTVLGRYTTIVVEPHEHLELARQTAETLQRQ